MLSDEEPCSDEEALTEEDVPPPPRAPAAKRGTDPDRLAVREAVLKEILACGWTSQSAKISPDALQLTSALVRSFALEAKARATAEAAASGSERVGADHLERVLPQLLLDFGP